MQEYTKIERYREMGEKYIIVAPCEKRTLHRGTPFFELLGSVKDMELFDSIDSAEKWLARNYCDVTRTSPIKSVPTYTTSDGYNFAIWSKTNMVQMLQKWNKK